MRHLPWLAITLLFGCGEVEVENADSSTSLDAATGDAPASDARAPDAREVDADETSCTPAQRCVPPAPALWEGPAMMLAATGTDPAPTCPVALSDVLLSAHVSLDIDPTTCPCSCTPSSAGCSHTTSVDYDDNVCSDALGGGSLWTTCSSLGGGSTAYKIFVPPVDTGSCQKNETPSIPPVQRTNARVLCQPTQASTECSGGGVCLGRLGNGDTYCVSLSGDQPCPIGSDYQDRVVVFTGVTDTRSCTACTCAGPTGTCAGRAELFNSACDSTPDRTVAADGTCRVETSYDNGRLIIDSVSASCTTTPGSAQGTATKAGLVTLCCMSF